LRGEIATPKGHAEEINRKRDHTASGDKRNETYGEMEAGKRIATPMVQPAKAKDETLQMAAQAEAREHFSGTVESTEAKSTQNDQETNRDKEEAKRQEARMNTLEKGARNNIPNKEEIAGCANQMKNETAETSKEFKKIALPANTPKMAGREIRIGEVVVVALAR
jgi:hypothetical protein